MILDQNEETNVEISFISKLIDKSTGNKFINLPKDLETFLQHPEGVMSSVYDNLYPDQYFRITISVGSLGK